MRILFLATYPNQPIGYSKVANVLTNYLASQDDVEILYMGTSNTPETALNDRFIHPKIQFFDILAEEAKRGLQDGYGVHLIEEVMLQYKPDVFFIYNDIIVTCRHFNALLKYRAVHPETRFVSYLDLVYPFECLEYVQHVNRNTDMIFVFSDCWQQNLLQMGVPANKVRILYHGINTDLFYPVDSQVARAYLNLPSDVFLLLNTNRNTYRKAQDITIAAFLQFLIKTGVNPRVKLFLNCHLNTTSGYDIRATLDIECIRLGLNPAVIKANHILMLPNVGTASDFTMNMLFNAADIGVNTCIGEGFGLCNIEHASVGVPQVVTGVGALNDIFGSHGDSIVVKPKVTIRVSNLLDGHSGDISIPDAADFAEAFYMYWKDTDHKQRDGDAIRRRLHVTYAWPTLLEGMWKDLKSLGIEKK